MEFSCREILLGEKSIQRETAQFEHFSAFASTYYLALFTICEELCRLFKSTNPTWTRQPRANEYRAWGHTKSLDDRFVGVLDRIRQTHGSVHRFLCREPGEVNLLARDSTKPLGIGRTIDMIISSPPYCTRIDYTSATGIQLAILWPLLDCSAKELSSKMLGTVRVPRNAPIPSEKWGSTCNRFLEMVKSHSSKASSGYYYKNHAAYFDGLSRSLEELSSCVKPNGTAIFVVQDSYYKDVHNNLPVILAEMASSSGFSLRRRDDFELPCTIGARHPHTRSYRRETSAVEAVLCFERH